jgi:hypothetical protein
MKEVRSSQRHLSVGPLALLVTAVGGVAVGASAR